MGESYKNGIINGGLSAGIAGFIYTLVAVLLLGGAILTLATAAGINVSSEIFAVITILGAIFAFIIYFILGLIGGIIGVAIKEVIRKDQHQ